MAANKNSRKRDVTDHQAGHARRVKWIDGAKVGQPGSGRKWPPIKVRENWTLVGDCEKWEQRKSGAKWMADLIKGGYPLCGLTLWQGDTPSMG